MSGGTTGREDHAREKLAGLGVLLARVIDQPTSAKVWRQGANGEVGSLRVWRIAAVAFVQRLSADALSWPPQSPVSTTAGTSSRSRAKRAIDRAGDLLA